MKRKQEIEIFHQICDQKYSSANNLQQSPQVLLLSSPQQTDFGHDRCERSTSEVLCCCLNSSHGNHTCNLTHTHRHRTLQQQQQQQQQHLG